MRDRLDEVIGVYKAAFLDQHEADPVRAAAERAAYARRHLDHTDLRAVVALTADDTVVGVAYGLPGRPGQWWHDVVAAALPAWVAADWLSDCLEVVELHVLPRLQGHGIGRRLLRALLDGVPQRTAALSALEEPGSRARKLYTSEGFVPLLEHFRFPGNDTRYAVLAKRLPGPSHATPTRGASRSGATSI